MPEGQPQIFISGLPGTGKSSLALSLGRQFDLPVFAKDHFKEAMYESAFPERNFSSMTPDQQRLFGKLSIQSVAVALEAMAVAGRAGIYEANFDGDLFSPILNSICDEYGIVPILAHLTCDREILVQRFEARERDVSRHPGHQGDREIDRVRDALLFGADKPLTTSHMEAFQFDTSDFTTVDFSPLFQAVTRAVQSN